MSDVRESDGLVDEALAALSSLAEQGERWLVELARVKSAFRSPNNGRHLWQPPGLECQTVLSLHQARPVLDALLAGGTRRVDYVRPAADPLLDVRPSGPWSPDKPRMHMRELLVRPEPMAVPDEETEIRATQAELPEVAILDAAIAFIPSCPMTLPATVAVVRDELVVAQLKRFFDAAWDHAALPPRREPILKASDSEIKVRIVRMLADGAKDETVARGLGISLRTCRKHVAEILEELGSSSRFQAGVRAGLAGMVPERWPR